MKKIFAVILLAILMAGSSMAYAWWDQLSQDQTETLQIGEGVTLTVNAVATAPADKVLVPVGAILKTNDVNQIDLTYNVKLDQSITNDLDLSVVASNIQIGGLATYADLVNISISQSSATVNDVDVLITVSVSISMPETQTIYDEIKNSPITFDLTISGS
jgi:hypothetical protein